MNNNIQDLKDYIEIINNYQHGNYRLKTEEIEKVKKLQMNKELQGELQKINNMAFSERKEYLKRLEEQQKLQEGKTTSPEEAIALTFGIDVSDIRVDTLRNGKQLYTFYNSSLGRNVTLQDGNNHSLISELEEIRKESNNDADMEKKDVLEDKRVKGGLEVVFIPLNEIGKHLAEISSFDEEKRLCLKHIMMEANKLGIVGINLENMIAINKDGDILEIHFDKRYNAPKVDNLDKNQREDVIDNKPSDNKELEEDEKLNSMLSNNQQKENITNNQQLADMLNDNTEELKNKKSEELTSQQKENSVKVLQREIPPVESSTEIAA